MIGVDSLYYASWIPPNPGLGFPLFEGIQHFLKERDLQGKCLPFWQNASSGESLLDQERIGGVVMFGGAVEQWRLLSEAELPVVNVSHSVPEFEGPLVVNDDMRAGERAAEHLLVREADRVVFLHLLERHFTFERIRGARGTCDKAGAGLEAVHLPGPKTPDKVEWVEQTQRNVRTWLQGRKKPLSVIVEDGRYAENLLLAAEALGWRVPEDLAVVMIGDPMENPMLRFVHNITHIPLDWRSVGAKAIEILMDWVEGGVEPPPVSLVPPLELVIKGSSGAGESDSLVARALTLMENSKNFGLNASDVARELGVAPVTLYKHFKEHRGHSLKKELMRWRTDNAQRLLSTTSMPIADISSRCGFSDVSNFTATFRRAVGQTPARYRKRTRS